MPTKWPSIALAGSSQLMLQQGSRDTRHEQSGKSMEATRLSPRIPIFVHETHRPIGASHTGSPHPVITAVLPENIRGAPFAKENPLERTSNTHEGPARHAFRSPPSGRLPCLPQELFASQRAILVCLLPTQNSEKTYEDKACPASLSCPERNLPTPPAHPYPVAMMFFQPHTLELSSPRSSPRSIPILYLTKQLIRHHRSHDLFIGTSLQRRGVPIGTADLVGRTKAQSRITYQAPASACSCSWHLAPVFLIHLSSASPSPSSLPTSLCITCRFGSERRVPYLGPTRNFAKKNK